jgi:hypothetical protein
MSSGSVQSVKSTGYTLSPSETLQFAIEDSYSLTHRQ